MTAPIFHRAPSPRRGRSRHTLRTVMELSEYRASYRQLDYWATTGRIDIGPKPGTGNWRMLSPAEIAAILDVIAENQRLLDENERVRSGDFYRERLAFHMEHEPELDLALPLPPEPRRWSQDWLSRWTAGWTIEQIARSAHVAQADVEAVLVEAFERGLIADPHELLPVKR